VAESYAAIIVVLIAISLTTRDLPLCHVAWGVDSRGFDLFMQRRGFSQTFSIGVWTFDAVLKQLAGPGVDTDFVCHATILDIEGIA
jgi:hypothetical protein